jgi:hypothetical protein
VTSCRWLTYALLVLCVVTGASGARADALRRVDRVVSGGGGDRSSSSSGRSSGSRRRDGSQSAASSGSDGDYSCGVFGNQSCAPEDSLWFGFFAWTIGVPWMIPWLFDDPMLVGYAPHPFAGGAGHLRIVGTSQDAAQASVSVALSLDAESGYLLEGVVPAALALRLRLPLRFELEARVSWLSDVREQPVELATVSTANLTYRFAQGRHVDFRTGFGVRMFVFDSVRAGLDLLYAVDAYLPKRLALHLELHAGLFDGVLVGQARLTLGAMVGRSELFAGYDHTAYLGRERARLGGPIAGLRWWF